MVKFTPVFALASALSMANAGDVYVRVRNLTYLQPFSPVFVMAHTNDVSIFREGFPASDAVKIMAEDGDNSALVELLASEDVEPYICGGVMGEAPLFPRGHMEGRHDGRREHLPRRAVQRREHANQHQRRFRGYRLQQAGWNRKGVSAGLRCRYRRPTTSCAPTSLALRARPTAATSRTDPAKGSSTCPVASTGWARTWARPTTTGATRSPRSSSPRPTCRVGPE
ncbi:unnamed protein product [Ectocarpus sp. 4 AP-2014]